MELSDDARPRLVPHVRMRFDAARQQHTLLSPETILVINDTGAAIVGLCDGEHSIAEIQSELRRRYDHVADDDVRRFVAELISKHSMEVDHG